MRNTLIFFATLMAVAGCGRSGPLDDASLGRLSRTGMRSASVTYPDGYQASLAPDDYELMRGLISALGPIKSADEGKLEDYDYELVYTAGMDPAIIHVKLIDDNQLTYKWGEYVYQGGNSTKFVEDVDEIRNRVEELRGEQLPTEP